MRLSGECANFEIDTGLNVIVGAFTDQPIAYNVNVNMRQVLGDMFDRYDKFLMVFNSIGMWGGLTSYTTAATGTTLFTNTAVWTLGVSGLDWQNSTYNGTISNVAYFPNRFTMPITSNYTASNSSTSNGVVFRRPDNPFVTLSASPYLTRQGGPALANMTTTTGNNGWDINYSFTIYGLEKE